MIYGYWNHHMVKFVFKKQIIETHDEPPKGMTRRRFCMVRGEELARKHGVEFVGPMYDYLK